MTNNWMPETRDLLRSLKKAGFVIIGGNNGEYKFNYRSESQMIADLTACDESTLCVALDGIKYLLWLVYGNSPGELVSDYNVCSQLDAVTDAHYAKWSGRKQPTVIEETL